MARTSDEPQSEGGPLQQEVQVSGCSGLQEVSNVTLAPHLAQLASSVYWE